MLVRSMTMEDIEEVASIEKELFSMPWSKDGFKDALKRQENVLLVAEEEHKVVGYICMYCVCGEGEITNVGVRPNCQGKGIGKEIVRQALERGVKGQLQNIVLEVRVSNAPARSLYRNVGFKELGIRKNFYQMPTEDAYIMEWKIESETI